MKVLVTGASGFVGRNVMRIFPSVHETVGIDRRRAPGVIGWEKRMLDLPAADVVISLAASANPRAALANPVGAYENNVQVMVKTMEHARRIGARVLHVSTNEVYGPERQRYRPAGPYAGGKACQEIICSTYDDVETTIVVTQSLFGPFQQRDKLIPSVIRNILDGEPVRLQRNGNGWAQRPFLHVHNLCDALLYLIDHPAGDRVHVGAGTQLTVKYAAEIIADELDGILDIEAIPAGDRAGHEATVELIGNDVPGWKPAIPAEPGLIATARWYRENHGWL